MSLYTLYEFRYGLEKSLLKLGDFDRERDVDDGDSLLGLDPHLAEIRDDIVFLRDFLSSVGFCCSSINRTFVHFLQIYFQNCHIIIFFSFL